MDFPKVYKAYRHVGNAWIAGLIAAGATLLMVILGEYSVEFRLKHGYDTWALLDVALILGLTYGIFKKSRFSALIMLLYFLVSKIGEISTTGSISGGIVTLIFSYFFFQGTIATFQLYTHDIETGKRVVKKNRVGRYIAIGASAFGIIFLGFVIVIGIDSPGTEVIPGKMLKQKYLFEINELGLLEKGENIIYWYSDALFDIEEGFYFFTDKKVVIYSEDFDEPAIIIPYQQIIEINFQPENSWLEDSRITLTLDDEQEIFFPVSSERGGDKKYFDLLLLNWQKGNTNDN